MGGQQDICGDFKKWLNAQWREGNDLIFDSVCFCFFFHFDSVPNPFLVNLPPFFQTTAAAEKKKKKRPKTAGEGTAGAGAGAAKGVKKMKKDFEKESEEDRFNRLSRNLQILLEDQDLNVPKICSTLVR